MSYQPLTFRTDGGNRMAVAPGGLLEFLRAVGTETLVSPALLFGGGSNAAPLTTSVAGKNFADLRTESTDATGADSRGIYWRHYLSGAGASGEAGRFYTTVAGAGAVGAHGIHASVSFGTNGTVTGQAAALRATLQVPNKALAGTSAAIYAEIYADGASSNNTGTMAFQRFVLAGEATGVAALNDVALLSLEGITVGSAGDGKVVDAISGDKAVTHLAKILINGTAYYIMLRNAV